MSVETDLSHKMRQVPLETECNVEEDTQFDSSDDEEDVVLSPLTIHWLDLYCSEIPNKLALSALPGCRYRQIRRDLEANIATIKQEDITDVFVVCTTGDLSRFRAPELLNAYTSSGLTVHHFPITVGDVPALSKCPEILNKLKECLYSGKKVLLHCVGGLGRSCVVAAMLILDLNPGITPEHLITTLRQIVGNGALQTVRQYNFINEYRQLILKHKTSDSMTWNDWNLPGGPRSVSR